MNSENSESPKNTNKPSFLKDPKNFAIVGVSIVALVFAALFVLQGNILGIQGKTISKKEASDQALTYLEDQLLQGQAKASISGAIKETENLYKFDVKVGPQTITSYVTKDGKMFFPRGFNLESSDSTPASKNNGQNQKKQQNQNNSSQKEIPKAKKPDVKLFIMSYCPYGLQAEKMYLPVYNLLKDKADMEIYFVDYAMHQKKELKENLRQYCIQKTRTSKYDNYLSCFVKSGDSGKCLSEANINESALQSCIDKTDQKYQVMKKFKNKDTWKSGKYPPFNVHSDLNEKYGVRGSPTIVINDKSVNVSPRTPEKFKETVCQAFQSPPSECSEDLSEKSPSPGIE